MRLKFTNFIILLSCFLPVLFFGCNKEFDICDSSILNLSSNNYTIEIANDSSYKGTYFITEKVIKKVTSSYTYYYFEGDTNRYYRGINTWECVDDKNEIYDSISMATSFFKTAKNILVNKDKTIFMTKSGNKIYNINTTNINFETANFENKSLEITNLSKKEKIIYTPSIIKISTNNSLTYYIKRTFGIQKFSLLNSSWQKVQCDIESFDSYKDNMLQNLGSEFINQSNIYLSKNGICVREYGGSLCSTFPSLTNNSYSVRNLSDNTLYNVTNDFIKITKGSKFVAYQRMDNIIYEFSNNNFNNYITKEISSSIDSINEIMTTIISDFALSYGNNTLTNYIIIGENTEYELFNIGKTNIVPIVNGASKVDDIKSYLLNNNYTIKDKLTNTYYSINDKIFEIANMNINSKEYYSLENEIIYHYKKQNDSWTKIKTEFTSLNLCFNFTQLFEKINNDKILKIENHFSNFDFESQNYEIYNYKSQIDIVLPTIN